MPFTRGMHFGFWSFMHIFLRLPLVERTYMTHEAKGHEIPVAMGNTVATGSSNCTGATNSFQQAWKLRSVQRGRALYATPPTPPTPWVLKDSSAGAMAPTAPNVFVLCLVERGAMPLVVKTLKTLFLANTGYHYDRIHTPIPPCPPIPP